MQFDLIDYKLLDLVQTNGRMSQIELASLVGLSQPAVAERLRKLEQDGVIVGFTAIVDAKKLGKDITAFIGVGIEHPRFNAGLAKKIMSIPEVLECHHVTGPDSYLLKVKTENTESLDRLISEQLRRIPGVTSTRTTIVMSSVKEKIKIVPEEAAMPRARAAARAAPKGAADRGRDGRSKERAPGGHPKERPLRTHRP